MLLQPLVPKGEKKAQAWIGSYENSNVDIGLIGDRATLRISSQHICNWLVHGILSKSQVKSALEKMAIIVDEQNAHDPHYHAMSTNFDTSLAYQAALDLIFKGTTHANGYTEPLLHEYRHKFNQMQAN